MLDGVTVTRSPGIKDELLIDGNDIELVSRSSALVSQGEISVVHSLCRTRLPYAFFNSFAIMRCDFVGIRACCVVHSAVLW